MKLLLKAFFISVFLFAFILFISEAKEDLLDLSTPQKIFDTYKKAIISDDVDLLKKCYSEYYLSKIKEYNPVDFESTLKSIIQNMKEEVARSTLQDVTYLNKGETNYDAILVIKIDKEKSTVSHPEKDGAFLYIVKENGDWKITLPKKLEERKNK